MSKKSKPEHRHKLLTLPIVIRAPLHGALGWSEYLIETGPHPDAVFGFVVRVIVKSKVYGVRHRRRFHAIGRTDIISLDDARARARELLRALRGGAATHGPGIRTVADLWTRYRLDRVDAMEPALGRHRLADRTRAEYARLWDAHLLPRLGKTLLRDLTPDLVWDLRRDLADRPVAANRAMQQLAAACNHGVELGWLEGNPAAKVETYEEVASGEVWTPETYRLIGKALRRCWRDGRRSPELLAGIELVILHGARPAEIVKARREWLDLKIPAIVHPIAKGDRRGRRQGRTIYLSPRGVELIRRVLLPIKSPWLIPSPVDPTKHAHRFQEAWKLVRKMAGVKVTLRSARSGWRTAGEAAGLPRAAIFRLGDWRGEKMGDDTYYRPTPENLAAAAATLTEHLLKRMSAQPGVN